MDDLFTPGLKSKAKNAFAMSVPFMIMVFTIIYTFVTGGDATLSMTVNNIVSSVIFCLLVVFMYVSVFSNCVKTAEDKYADKYEAALKAYEDERRITSSRSVRVSARQKPNAPTLPYHGDVPRGLMPVYGTPSA